MGGLNFEGGLDYHAMWIDPTNRDRFYVGKDKGLTLTHDHGETFILFDNLPVGQFYAVGIDKGRISPSRISSQPIMRLPRAWTIVSTWLTNQACN